MGRVVHFEIQASDPVRAAEFYSVVFGWRIEQWKGPEEYWLVKTAQSVPTRESTPDGIDGAITRRLGANPSAAADMPVIGYVCTIDVENIDEAIEKVKAAGGLQVRSKVEVPGLGWMCYAKDTEGNIFGMMQPTARA